MFSLENIDDSRQICLFLESLKFQFDSLFTTMASNRDFYRPTLIALEVIDQINNDLDSDEEDLYEGNESYDDEEGGDIFTNLMRAAIDQSLDLDLDLDLVSELSSSRSDLEDDLDFDLQDSHRSRSRSRSRSSSRSRSLDLVLQ